MSEPRKSLAQPRQLTIKISYHFTKSGRRPGIRADIMVRAIHALVRRLEKHDIVVDGFEVVENKKVTLGA
jgi:hypothetical protein